MKKKNNCWKSEINDELKHKYQHVVHEKKYIIKKPIAGNLSGISATEVRNETKLNFCQIEFGNHFRTCVEGKNNSDQIKSNRYQILFTIFRLICNQTDV